MRQPKYGQIINFGLAILIVSLFSLCRLRNTTQLRSGTVDKSKWPVFLQKASGNPTPQWKKIQVYLCASWGAWSLKCNTERLDRQTDNLRQSWSSLKQKMLISLSAHEVGLSIRNTEFCKNDSDSSLGSLTVTRFESSHSVKKVTRVESPFFSTWLESSPSHQISLLESSHWFELRYHSWKLKTVWATFDITFSLQGVPNGEFVVASLYLRETSSLTSMQ